MSYFISRATYDTFRGYARAGWRAGGKVGSALGDDPARVSYDPDDDEPIEVFVLGSIVSLALVIAAIDAVLIMPWLGNTVGTWVGWISAFALGGFSFIWGLWAPGIGAKYRAIAVGLPVWFSLVFGWWLFTPLVVLVVVTAVRALGRAWVQSDDDSTARSAS